VRERVHFSCFWENEERRESMELEQELGEGIRGAIFVSSSIQGKRVDFIFVGDSRKGRMSISPHPNFLHPIFVLA